MRLVDRRLTAEEARAVARWRYPPPFDRYDLTDDDAGLLLRRTGDDEGYYPAVDGAGGELVGFAVFGSEARVPGQSPAAGVVDLGGGLRPDLIGRGLGRSLLDQAVVVAVEAWQPVALRTAVAAFNERSLALCQRAGFTPVRDVEGPGGRAFRELELRWSSSVGAVQHAGAP